MLDLKPGGRFMAVDVDTAGGIAGARSAWWSAKCGRVGDDGDRPDARRRGRGGEGDAGAGSDASASTADQGDAAGS